MKRNKKILFLFTIFFFAAFALSMTNCKADNIKSKSKKKDLYRITSLEDNSGKTSKSSNDKNKLSRTETVPTAPDSEQTFEIDLSLDPVDTSILSDKSDLQYYYETTDYCYGITNDGQEVFSHRNPDGTKIDVLNGGGTATIWNNSDTSLCQARYLSKVELLEDSPTESIRVTYENTMEGSSFTTTYTFYEHYVKAHATLNNFQTTAPIDIAFLERTYPNSYTDVERKISSNWIFPDNQDFPYKEFDSFVTVHSIDDTHKLYTFYHGENANIEEFYEYYPKDHFILKTENGKLINTEVSYELVFENTETDSDCDYFALFKSKGQPLTLKITPTENNSYNSSVFTNKNTKLNLNISNISSAASEGLLTFHLYDYYGNDVLSDSYSISLETGMECNRILQLSEITQGKTGIYYLDMMLTGEDYTYRELYPFALLPDYTYAYRQNNPFGISGMRFGEYEANDTTVYLADVLGMSHARVGISAPEYVSKDYTLLTKYLKKLTEKGIQVSGQFILMDNWTYPSDSISFERELTEALSETAPYLSAMEIGNEQNMIDVPYNYFETSEASMEYYLNTQFNSGAKVIKGFNLPVISAGVGLSDSQWLTLLKTSGVFDNSDILSTHAYSYPHSPDFTKDANIEHSFESSLVRVRNFLDTTGDKTWYLSEMGLPTTPLLTENTFSGVGLRTQADYTIREYLLALSYGADVVESYSFYDQLNMFKGIDNQNNELNFGMFYDQDYYGRILPKPYAVAYGTMTRQLDGVKEVKEIDSHSATLRIFQITLADNQTFLAIYSTANKLTNDAITGKRTPNLPWLNQWPGYETVNFTQNSKTSEIYTIDLMGNKKTYKANTKGTVSIPVDGSPVFIYGASYK